MSEPASLYALPALESHIALLLGSFSADQREKLKTFSQCALFCEDPSVRKLLAYMIDHLARRPQDGFLVQILYMEGFNRKIVEPDKMAVLFTHAIALIEEFIAVSILKTDPMKKCEYLARHAAELPETTVFQAALSQWQQAIEAAPETYEKLYQKLRILQEEWAHWATDRYKKAPLLIHKIIFAHDEYYRSVKRLFKHAEEMRANLLNENAPERISAGEQNILLLISDQLVALHETPADEDAFQACLDTYIHYFKRLGNAEREFVLRSLINYCIRQTKSGHIVFIQHLFQLCNWATRQRAFTARWLRSDADFLNIAMAFCRPDALQEMYDFIHKHSKNLPPDLHDQACALALAYYHFFKGELKTSLDYLNKVISWKIHYKLRYHSLRIRICYQMGKTGKDFDALDTAFDAYDKYFERDEWLHDKRRDNYIRLAWFVRKMMLALSSTRAEAKAEAYTFLQEAIQDKHKATPVALDWIMSEISKWRPGN